MKTITITLLTLVGVASANTLPPSWENTLPPTWETTVRTNVSSLTDTPVIFENTLPPTWEMVGNKSLTIAINE